MENVALVSIPYGKGKARDVPLDFIKRGLVSIPYGKGKDTETLLTHDEIIEYQFPMGKVKSKSSNLVQRNSNCINSLWER